MCRAAHCRTCGRTTWSGCGQHVAQVKGTVRADDWCPGHDDQPSDGPLGRLFLSLSGSTKTKPRATSRRRTKGRF